METSALKSFAPWARTALINEVTGRIAGVLGPASPERVEQPRAVAALDNAVKDAGGGDIGRAAVAEQVAYTWFNRIIALRFMDANGYTGIGVVSPQGGIEVGQPEILAEAKAGNFDSEVVSPQIRDTVSGLLDGTRRSADPQGEAYALLITDYCRHWHRAMPFMFEREGDFTELLIPANLLADESVLNRAVKVMTEEVCNDVEVIGWLYQFYISERKDEVFAGFKKGKKAGAAEIPAATQLFTPHWIVRYLVENSVGRLWMLNRPNSRLVDQMEYYIAPVDEETDFLKISGPEKLTVMDPACGSGHMLTYAFDLLYAIYEEEGYSPSEIPGLILTKNLFGVEIDPRAGALAAFALTMKARERQRAFFGKKIVPNICVLEPIRFTPQELDFLLGSNRTPDEEIAFWNQFWNVDVFGSLVQPASELFQSLEKRTSQLGDQGNLHAVGTIESANHVLRLAGYLAQDYSVVVANPPYMGSKNTCTQLNEWLKENYPLSSTDLYSAFIERAITLCRVNGVIAMITMHSWMFLSTSRELRKHMSMTTVPAVFAHLGTRAFEAVSGEVVSTVAFAVNKMSNPAQLGLFMRLTHFPTADLKMSALASVSKRGRDSNCYLRSLEMFYRLPGSRLMYWLTAESRHILEESAPLEDFAPAIQGMITGSNARFLRLWHEVALPAIGFDGEDDWGSARRWAPYNKGGEARRWYGAQSHVVNWSNTGSDFVRNRSTNRQFYFREYLSWSYRSSEDFAPRYYPEGFLWDVAGSGVFPATREALLTLLALLCSSTGAYLMNCLNPTSTFQVENVLELPVVSELNDRIVSAGIHKYVKRAIEIAQQDWDASETSWNFKSLLLNGIDGSLPTRLRMLFKKYKIDCDELTKIEAEIDLFFADLYSLKPALISPDQPRRNITLDRNYFGNSIGLNGDRYNDFVSDSIRDIASYAVGCMFGRYSLDEPGLILADQGATLQDYLAKVPTPTFTPDADNVLPIIDGDWFEDDIVVRFRQFLRAAFGEEHFEENLRFVTESLGVKDIRDYFVKSFYKDHVQRYKKRPIYWLFSSSKGSFNALIYMHRYTPSTVSTVLNEYLREYKAKLKASLENQERVATSGGSAREQAKAQKEADRLRKVLLELDEYEHDVLYPSASQQIEIDLDDGVKANYPKFGAALKKIAGLEAAE